MKTIKILVFLILTLLATHTFGQKQVKIYYNYAWEVSSAKDASYYRLISYDKNGKVTGTVKDYYISGKLQMESDAISIDKSDDKNSKWKKQLGYYKSGRKESLAVYDADGNLNYAIAWPDKEVASYSYFETSGLNNLENFALEYSNDFFDKVVAGTEIFNFSIDVKKKQNEIGGDFFTLYDVDIKQEVAWLQYTKEKELIAAWIMNYEMADVEKELASQGFTMLSEQTEKRADTGKTITKYKWGKKNYPYHFILRYVEEKKTQGLVILVSNISPQY